tara:strand:- start:88 stop:894 length:807 start_codon:yes stop_codon:yes gene_type:complete
MTDLHETNEVEEEEVANPYNMRKEWHDDSDQPFESADGMFFEKPTKKATRKAPSNEEATDYKKRYDDLKKHYDTKVSEFKQKEQELQAEARMTQQVEQAVRHEDAVEEVQDEYVETEPAVETDTRLSALEERESRLARKEAELTLSSAHPDFADIRQSDEFHTWAKSQPEVIQEWVYNNPDDVSLAVKAIDLYKMEAGMGNQPSSGKKAQSQPVSPSAADMVSTKTKTVNANEPKVWTQREIAALSMDDYDKYEKEIDSAIIEGRVVA